MLSPGNVLGTISGIPGSSQSMQKTFIYPLIDDVSIGPAIHAFMKWPHCRRPAVNTEQPFNGATHATGSVNDAATST